MSWDCTVVDKDTKKPILWSSIPLKDTEKPEFLKGGTYALFTCQDLWINVTYNYSLFYNKFLNAGLEYFHDMPVKKSLPILENIRDNLNDDVSSNYWQPTEGNAKKAIKGLIYLAQIAPEDSVWEVY